jgi:hypothetical protein
MKPVHLKVGLLVLALAAMGVAAALAFTDKVSGAEALAFIGGTVLGGVVGLVGGAKTAMVVLAFGALLAGPVGCATGLDAVDSALPKVASGVHVAATAGHSVLHQLCEQRAGACRANGVTEKERCPGWLKCDSVRVALEEVTRAVEDDLVSIKSKVEAFRKVQAAIAKMKEE